MKCTLRGNVRGGLDAGHTHRTHVPYSSRMRVEVHWIGYRHDICDMAMSLNWSMKSVNSTKSTMKYVSTTHSTIHSSMDPL